ncbi:MAG: VWA domain-containing protein [Acidobacteria bacterium]|nr:VWA domain-containing protein [Acidobacteriota bacterium]
MKSILVLAIAGGLMAQELTILDPTNGAYVSGSYEVVLQCDAPNEVVRTKLEIDGKVVFDESGWHSSLDVFFGESFDRRVIQASVALADGSVVLSPPIRTDELRVFYEESTRLVLISAIVQSRFGRSVERLEREDFRVFENGTPVKLETFSREQVPLDLVLVLDTSSSLRGAMDTLKKEAVHFLDQLNKTDRVALFSFGNASEIVMDFTNDAKIMRRHIEGFEAYGETALFDTLLLALDRVAKRQRGRRAIVLFTDGRDSIYEEPQDKARLFRQTITHAQNAEVAIFTIGLGKRINEDALSAMADETGGRYYHADGFGDLTEPFNRVLTDLRQQYMLGVVPLATSKGFQSLEVKVKKFGARVLARKGYTLE